MIITQTPLRISFAGGGTDFPEYYNIYGGCVVSMTIDKYIYIIVKERYDDLIYINYSQKEIVSDVEQIKHDLIRESLKKVGIKKGIEITCLADIPSEGTGLGSSGSFTVGLLNALYTFKGFPVDPKKLAEDATEIEMVKVGRPIGLQDQYIAAYGGLNLLEFHDDYQPKVTKIELNIEELRRFISNIFLFYTNKTRSSSSILEDQKNKINVNTRLLASLKEQGYYVYRCLLDRNFDQIGCMLNQSWNLKKALANGISNEIVDELYSTALQNGALGGKICGAGGGGFMMIYCPKENHEKLKSSLKAKELPFDTDLWGSRVIFNVTRQVWKI